MTRFISEQNENIDIIENKIKKAKMDITEGNKDLDTAKEYFEKERTNKCCFLMWLFMAFGAILIPIILGILNSNGIF